MNLFGPGTLGQLPELLPPERKILLMTGRSAGRLLPVQKLIRTLGGRIVSHVTGISPEPTLTEIAAYVAKARKTGAECVVSIGGGSVVDAGKAVAALAPAPEEIPEYFYGRSVLPGKGLFFAAVPTTAGTGAESTSNAVLIDGTTRIKQSLRSPSMLPDLAVTDPLLMLSCPPEVTASSGLDAYVQAFESHTSPKATPETRKMTAEAVKLILENLETACRHPEDLDARTAMARAAMITGQAFAKTGLGAIHGFAHPAGALLKIPHGKICAILMKPVIRFNTATCGEQYRFLASLAGKEDFAEVSEELAGRFGIRPSLREYGFSEEQIPFIVKNCRSGSMKNNPRPVSDAEAEELLKGLL